MPGSNPIRTAWLRRMKLPKAPASKTSSSSSTPISARLSRISMPARIDPEASWSSRTSRWKSATGSPLALLAASTSTKAGSPSSSCSRRVRAGATDGAASSAVSRAPVSSMAPASSSKATTSIKAEPQSPRAGRLPMTLTSRLPSSSSMIFSIAPSAARMPCLMRAPSKAGPAAVEVASSCP